MSDSEKKRPVPVVERIRPIRRDNMMAVQSRTVDLPAPFTPTRTLICSGNSNFSSGIPLNPSISMDSILILLPANRQKNVEHGPEQRPTDAGAKGTLPTRRRGGSIRTRTRAGARLRPRCHRPRGARNGGVPRHSLTGTPRIRRCGWRGSAPAIASVVALAAAPATKPAEALAPRAWAVASGDVWCLSMRHPSGSFSSAALGHRDGGRGDIVAFRTTERTPLRFDGYGSSGSTARRPWLLAVEPWSKRAKRLPPRTPREALRDTLDPSVS